MVITFLCPAGHKLTSPPELAGKPGKCPKCGATFRVPVPEPEEPAAPGDEAARAGPWSDRPATPQAAAPGQAARAAGSPVNGPAAPSQKAVSSDAPAPTAGSSSVAEPELFLADDAVEGDDSHIVFLCPNGHRLHGPAALVGKPGQCPECGIKFLVPSPDEQPEEELAPDSTPLGDIQVNVESSPRGGKGLLERLTGSGSKKVASGEPADSALADSLPALFRLLWACKEQGGLIEVHLNEGKVIVPEQFAPHLSGGEHAVFGLREAGGTHSVTVVPWSAITHVALRGLAALPRAIFPPGS